MKHYFIVNPIAGPNNCYDFVYNETNEIFNNNDDFVIYTTKYPGDALEYVKSICDSLQEDAIFYACGGDGTVFEVVNGMANCQFAILAILPTGSCNDFLKSYPGYNFSKIKNLVNGQIVPVDLIKVNNYYCINVANAGFDAKVNYDVCQMLLKFNNVNKAYKKAVIKNILHFNADHIKVSVDDEQVKDDQVLLMALGNGGYYGGGYKCCPYYDTADGLLECVIVDKISLFQFARLVKIFKRGDHIEDKRTKDVVTYKKAKHIVVDSKQDICFCLDGETIWGNHFDVSCLKHQIRFILPNENI